MEFDPIPKIPSGKEASVQLHELDHQVKQVGIVFFQNLIFLRPGFFVQFFDVVALKFRNSLK